MVEDISELGKSMTLAVDPGNEAEQEVKLSKLQGLAFDHLFITKKCVKCTEIPAQHEMDHTNPPLDSNQIIAYLEQAREFWAESKHYVEEAKGIKHEAEQFYKQGMKFMEDATSIAVGDKKQLLDEILDEVKKYVKVSAAAITGLGSAALVLMSILG